MKIYGLSGLGADERVYEYLNHHLTDKIIPITWITPLSKETLEEYALRISEKIDTSQNFILVGVSFGGMMAVEIAKFITPHKIVLISSAATRSEIPLLFRLFGLLRLHKLIPEPYIMPPRFITKSFFSVKNKEHEKILFDILDKTDQVFFKWAIGQISNWRNRTEPQNLIRIHGNKDRVLPLATRSLVELIPNSGHFLVVEKAAEVAKILKRVLVHQ